MIRRCMRVMALLLAALCVMSAACAQEPVYSSTRAFESLLREAGITCEAHGVDEDGDDSLSIRHGEHTILCFFGEDGESVSFLVWYLIDYMPEDAGKVIRACNALNAASSGPVCYADESDCTVTMALDLTFAENAAGPVAWRGYGLITQQLSAAEAALTSFDITASAGSEAWEEPIAWEMPEPVVDEAPAEPVVTPSPAPTAEVQQTPAPQPAFVVITAATARVRSGPSTTSPYLCTARQGEKYPMIGVVGQWYIIDCDGRTGFVSMSMACPE